MPERVKPGRELALEAAELTSCDPETSVVLCDSFLYEPDAGEEPLGSLFLVAETINLPVITRPGDESPAGNAARNILDAVSRAARDAYYQDPDRPMVESFEAALAAANAVLADLAAQGDTSWLENFHAAAGVFQGTTLHVSRCGAAELLLARRGQITDIGEGLSDPKIRHPQHAFTNTASGTLAEQDALILSSANLLRLVPRDRLGSFLSGKSPREAVTHLRDLLAETTDAPSFATLFLRGVRAPIALPAPRSPLAREAPAGAKWAGDLGAAPPRVEGSMAPRGGGWSAPMGTITARAPAATPALVRARPRPPLRLRTSRLQRSLDVARRGGILLGHVVGRQVLPALVRATRVGASTAKRVLGRTATVTKARLAARGTPGGTAALSPAVGTLTTSLARVKESPLRLQQTVRRWPQSTKVFAVLTLILAILLAISAAGVKRKRLEQAKIEAVVVRLEEARVKKDAASAALIYENTDDARRLLGESRVGLQAIEPHPSYNDRIAALRAEIQDVEDRAEGIVRVPEPTRVGDFGGAVLGGRVHGLTALGPNLFAYAPETNAVLRLATENGETTVVSQTSQGIGYFRDAVALPTEQMLLFATDTPGLALFDSARGDLLKQDLQGLPEGTKEIRALATFGSRLYLLLPEQKQIYGFSKTLAGYQGGTSWLTDENVAADRAVGMGVDGYIYLLHDDGTIMKLLKGTPVEFQQTALATPLRDPARLVINEGLKYLYVLDRESKRVIVYDTTGKLSRQFHFPNATELRDITVAGKDETLYVLDGTTVYRVALK